MSEKVCPDCDEDFYKTCPRPMSQPTLPGLGYDEWEPN